MRAPRGGAGSGDEVYLAVRRLRDRERDRKFDVRVDARRDDRCAARADAEGAREGAQGHGRGDTLEVEQHVLELDPIHLEAARVVPAPPAAAVGALLEARRHPDALHLAPLEQRVEERARQRNRAVVEPAAVLAAEEVDEEHVHRFLRGPSEALRLEELGKVERVVRVRRHAAQAPVARLGEHRDADPLVHDVAEQRDEERRHRGVFEVWHASPVLSSAARAVTALVVEVGTVARRRRRLASFSARFGLSDLFVELRLCRHRFDHREVWENAAFTPRKAAVHSAQHGASQPDAPSLLWTAHAVARRVCCVAGAKLIWPPPR